MATAIEYGLIAAAVGLALVTALPVLFKDQPGKEPPKTEIVVNGDGRPGPVCVEAGAELGGGTMVYVFETRDKVPKVLARDSREVSTLCSYLN